MFADGTSGYPTGHTSGFLKPSFSSTSWDIPFANDSRTESYDSTFDRAMVENQYSSVSNGQVSLTQGVMPNYAEDASRFSMNGNNQMEEYLTQVPSTRFSAFSGSVYEPLGYRPTQGLALNTHIDMLQATSNMVSTQESFVIPSHTTLLDTYDPSSPMRGSDFDTSPISECPTDYSFGSTEDENHYMSSVGSVSSYGSVKSEPTTPTKPVYFDQHMLGQALETSVALHRVQFDDRDTRVRHKRPVRRQTSMIPNFSLQVQQRAMRMCSFSGCNKKFRRQEHLKRHERTHTNTEWHPCPFCNKAKPFSRPDNLKSHIKLHCAYKKSARTDFHPDAQEYYNDLCRKSTRKSTGSRSDQTKSEPGLKLAIRSRL